jgi:hypothetical protein
MSTGGYGGLDVNNNAMGQALQDMSAAIGESASLYAQATTQVTTLAQNVATENISQIQKQGSASEAVLSPFQAAGTSTVGTLSNLLGINGTQAQQQAVASTSQAATQAGQQADFNALNSMFGTNFQSSAPVNQPIPPTATPMTTANGGLAENPAYTNWVENNTLTDGGKNVDSNIIGGLGPAPVQNVAGPNAAAITAANNQAQSQYQSQLNAYNNPTPPPSQAANQQTLMNGLTGGNANQILNSALGGSNAANITSNMNASLGGNANALLNQAAGGNVNAAPGVNANNTLNDLTSGANNALSGYLNTLDSYGTKSLQNSAAANGMLNSGATMQSIYNMGQTNSAQYLQPYINGGISLANTNMQDAASMYNQGQSSASTLAGQTQGVAGSIYNQGLSNLGSVTGDIVNGTTSTNNNAANAQVTGLTNTLNTGAQTANTQAGVLGQLGSAISQQNTNMADTTSNAILSNAQNQSNALLSNAQLQFAAAQMPGVGASNSSPGSVGVMAGGDGLLAGLGMMAGI